MVNHHRSNLIDSRVFFSSTLALTHPRTNSNSNEQMKKFNQREKRTEQWSMNGWWIRTGDLSLYRWRSATQQLESFLFWIFIATDIDCFISLHLYSLSAVTRSNHSIHRCLISIADWSLPMKNLVVFCILDWHDLTHFFLFSFRFHTTNDLCLNSQHGK